MRVRGRIVGWGGGAAGARGVEGWGADRKSQSRHRPEGMDEIHGRQSIMNLETEWAGGRNERVGGNLE